MREVDRPLRSVLNSMTAVAADKEYLQKQACQSIELDETRQMVRSLTK